VCCFHGRLLWFGGFCAFGGCGVLLPLTFKISYSICVVGLSSQIVVSGSRPVPCAFVTVIISPLSYIFSPQRLACLYTSALFVYSVADNDKLHFSGPFVFLIAAYSLRRAVLDAHSIAMRSSPLGVDTLLQPVRSAQSVVIYFSSCSFHSSTFPTKRL
jgi:hypothetical protein